MGATVTIVPFLNPFHRPKGSFPFPKSPFDIQSYYWATYYRHHCHHCRGDWIQFPCSRNRKLLAEMASIVSINEIESHPALRHDFYRPCSSLNKTFALSLSLSLLCCCDLIACTALSALQNPRKTSTTLTPTPTIPCMARTRISPTSESSPSTFFCKLSHFSH